MVSLTSQEKMANHLQEYETFRLVVNEALGGSTNATEDSDAIGTFAELSKAFEAIGGSVG